jgi:hypothetical protein
MTAEQYAGGYSHPFPTEALVTFGGEFADGAG